MNNFKESVLENKTSPPEFRRARLYFFYFKLQHNSIISPEYSDGNDDAYDVMYYSYFVFFVLQI